MQIQYWYGHWEKVFLVLCHFCRDLRSIKGGEGDPSEGDVCFISGFSPRPIRLVMEASGNSAYLCKYLEDLVEEIKITHPFDILPYLNSQTFSSIDSMSPPHRAPMLTLIA